MGSTGSNPFGNTRIELRQLSVEKNRRPKRSSALRYQTKDRTAYASVII
jgi:hypothetical protein